MDKVLFCVAVAVLLQGPGWQPYAPDPEPLAGQVAPGSVGPIDSGTYFSATVTASDKDQWVLDGNPPQFQVFCTEGAQAVVVDRESTPGGSGTWTHQGFVNCIHTYIDTKVAKADPNKPADVIIECVDSYRVEDPNHPVAIHDGSFIVNQIVLIKNKPAGGGGSGGGE